MQDQIVISTAILTVHGENYASVYDSQIGHIQSSSITQDFFWCDCMATKLWNGLLGRLIFYQVHN
jgi:hypothetical protein